MIPALKPLSFQVLLRFASSIVTDSAGVQQEALLSGKLVIVTRSEVELYNSHQNELLVPPPFVWNSSEVNGFLARPGSWIIPDLHWKRKANGIAQVVLSKLQEIV
jgi:hypothetical protein